MTERYPTYSGLRISGQLKLIGIGVSPAAVRAVWQRHGLTLRVQRLLWLEQKTAAAGGVLTDRQIRRLHKRRSRTADPEQHVDTPYPGYLLCQDTFFVGTIHGVGKVYMQSVMDAHCSFGFAKPYLSKIPMTAIDVLHDRFSFRRKLRCRPGTHPYGQREGVLRPGTQAPLRVVPGDLGGALLSGDLPLSTARPAPLIQTEY